MFADIRTISFVIGSTPFCVQAIFQYFCQTINMSAPSTKIEVNAACILIQMAYTLTPAEVIERFSAEIAAATQSMELAVPATITPTLKRKRKQSLVPRNIRTEIRSTSGPGNFDGYEWTSSPESTASGSSETAVDENRKEAEYQRQPNKKNASNMSLRGKLKVPVKLQ